MCHNGLPRIFCPSAVWKKKWCDHLVGLFRLLTIWVTSGGGRTEYVGWLLVVFRGNSALHADIVFIQISLVDVGCGHSLIIVIFQCCKVDGVVAPRLFWDMPFRDLKFGEGLRIGCDTLGRFNTGGVVASSRRPLLARTPAW